MEDAGRQISPLANETAYLQADNARLGSENAQPRHLLAQAHARLLETQVTASGNSPRPANGLEGKITVLNECR